MKSWSFNNNKCLMTHIVAEQLKDKSCHTAIDPDEQVHTG